jgi:hypothetical protein
VWLDPRVVFLTRERCQLRRLHCWLAAPVQGGRTSRTGRVRRWRPGGTGTSPGAMHRSRVERDTHERLGFFAGWGTVTGQLAELTEQDDPR